jgi:transposase-like protein
MALTQIRCTDCGGKNVDGYRTYTIKYGEQRTMSHCSACGCYFSETKNTPIAHVKTPISVIVQVILALTEGVGINAVTRLYSVSKNRVYRWQERLSGLKNAPIVCLAPSVSAPDD